MVKNWRSPYFSRFFVQLLFFYSKAKGVKCKFLFFNLIKSFEMMIFMLEYE